MDAAAVNALCATLPGAVLDHPFGPDTDTWKVGGKIFAIINVRGDGVILKCPDPDTAEFLKDIGLAEPAPYLKRGGWVLVRWSVLARGDMAMDDLAARLSASHGVIVAGLPKRLRPGAP